MPALSQINVYQILLIIFIISASSFVLSLGYTIYYWYHESHKKKETQGVNPRDAAIKEAINIVDTARTHAMQYLQDAQSEAQKILHDSENVHTSTKDIFEERMQALGSKQLQTFDALSQELLTTYKSVLSQEKDTSLRSIMDVSSALQNELSTEVHSFADSIKQVATETESSLRRVADETGSTIRQVAAETENTIRNDFTNQYGQIEGEMNNLSGKIKEITQEAEEKMRTNLGGQYELVQNEISGLSEAIKNVVGESVNSINSSIAEESEEVKNVIHNFSETLKKAALDTEVLLRQEVKNEFEKVKQELVDYKNEKLQKVDNAVTGMLEEVARDVLGKVMSMSDHEEMIMKSLESIKRSTDLKEL